MRHRRLLSMLPWLILALLGSPAATSAVAPPSSPTVRVAGIVLKWVRGDKEANFRRIEPLIRQAAAKGARIVCTTECFLDGYAIADKTIPLETYRSLGEPIPGGKYYRRLAELAGKLKIHLIAGMLEADGEARYNTAVLIGPDGKLIGKYRKQKLGHESVRNTAGTTSKVFATPYGHVGLMICADRTDPKIVQRICGKGADFLICPSGGMFGPKSNDPIVQARSRENRIPIIFVHPAEFLVTGPDGSIQARTILGNSLLIQPDHVGKEKDKNEIFYFDLPVRRKPAVSKERHSLSRDAPAERVAAQRSPFDTDILPILQTQCLRCHGDKARRADLDLRSPAAILKGGESGPAVVPGKPDQSLLYEKVHTGAMPPGKKNRLTQTEVAAIRKWIAEGASQPTTELTQHDVLPILLRRCTVCHGLRRQEAGLDLRTRAAMLKGGKSGPSIVPGKPEQSLLLQKIREGAMPPRKRLVEVSVKPIEPGEIEILTRWIAQGAPEVEVAPDVATSKPDPLVSERDRDFWAFRTPGPVRIPAVHHSAQVRNPIDAFVLARLEEKGLSLSPEADRLTLLRRAYFDLTGLPPNPDEVQAFLTDRDPAAYEKLIDRLLASPHLGERWGRHWLDVAGYADSEGKREQDLDRPWAWRYRDYVIRSFNTDKPYDRFLLEQIAGDELADYEKAPEITQEIYDNLVATGFLRMAPDATWANITGFIPDRLEVIADEIDVLGSAVMGLTLKCARCHSHKFDPIPQRDYYRLVDIFKGAYDEYDWLKPDVRPGIGPVSEDVLGGRLLPHVTTEERRAWQEHNAKICKQIESAQQRKNTHLVKALQAQLRPEPRIQALWDRGEPSPTYIYRRGDYLSPGRLVGPGVPSVLTDGKTPFIVHPPWPGAKKTGRRLAFARWLIRPDHPLTARVLVNRLWKLHFGTGIVTTLGNFGKAGARPGHPELLDWLAREFVRQGFRLKPMHRLMMTSTTYRQSSAVTPAHKRLDPGNVLYSRMPLARLDAEALYDALLLVAGELDQTPFGPGDRVQVRPDGLVTPVGSDRGWRRLIYVRQTRKQLPTHLENFDYPQMNPNCLQRRDSTVAPQALHLMNNSMVRTLAEHFARRVRREAGTDPIRQIKRAYLIALSRPPSEKELQLGRDSLALLRERWATHLAGTDKREAAAEHALASYCHMMMNSASFLYVD